MAHTKQFFLEITQRIFSNWTALKMAVEHGMGPKARAVEFCLYITEIFYMNENLSSSDIAIELEDFMDYHFNTELQDNSIMQVAEELLRFHHYCIQNNEVMATTELGKLPPSQPWLMSPQHRQSNNFSSPVDSDSSSEEDMEKTGNPMDEGWTEVRSRRHR